MLLMVVGDADSVCMNHKKQGDIGVGVAIAYYMKQGYVVCYPLTDTARYDLIVDKAGSIERVQVKTTRAYASSGRPKVRLETCGGNQSWSGNRKRISSDECDLVFINTDTCNFEIPSIVIAGMTTLTLGDKYSQYKLG